LVDFLHGGVTVAEFAPLGREELGRRRSALKPRPKPTRGHARLCAESVLQAEHGCDFDFLRAEGRG
jgi:hypothetical protein